MPPAGENVEPTGGKTGTRVSGKCESVEVACEVNELWKQDLKLHEWQLKIAEKQLTGNNHLVEAVQVLMGALDCTSLGNVSVCGGVHGSRSMWKGKERVDVESSLGESNEDDEDDADGEKEGSEGEGEGDDDD